MASRLPHVLARRVASTTTTTTSSSSTASVSSHIPIQSTARSFTTSAQHNTVFSSRLAALSSDSHEQFEKNKREFRERLAKSRQEESRSNPYPSASASASASASGDSTPGKSEVERPLGSLSHHVTEEAFANASKQGSTAPSGDGKKSGGALSKLIYGTEEGRQMDQDIERSFSQMLARGKYLHSIVFHDVKPDRVEEYIKVIGDLYPKIANDPSNKVNLVGSWKTEVGEADTFVHIWEYQRYDGYHESLHHIWAHPNVAEADALIRTMLNSRKTSLMQEFSFWPTTSPRKLGGVFELRAYTLHPGNLLEWETHWRKGLEARREVMEGVGAWFVQIGDLNTVYHLWQFANLEDRRLAREKSWSIEGWSDTVHKTVPLIQSMQSKIMVPMEWSPVA